jgi:hypothetical protein
MRRQTFTDNSHLATKVRVRTEALARIGKTDIRVLDAFAGDGVVWARMKRELPDLNITVLGIEKKKYLNPATIMGDNRKVMRGLDLTQFDLLDAFGCPWEQLAICADKAPNVPVVATHIIVTLGPVPKPVLTTAGIPAEWADRRKVPHALFNRWRWEWWENYCASLGYTETEYELHLDNSAVKRYESIWRNPTLPAP